ncbi:MAG: DEAD/DEAH box helicase, partial [Deferribacterales bacterium]
MHDNFLFIKQLNNIINNRGHYYLNYKKLLKPFLDFSICDDLKVEINEIINKDSVESKKLDEILTSLIAKFYPYINNSFSLNDDLYNVYGKVNKTVGYLKKFGINTVQDILFHFPYRYEALICNGGERGVLSGILEDFKVIKTKYGKKIFEAVFKGDGQYFYGVWFNFNNKYPVGVLKRGVNYNLYGKLQYFNSLPAIIHPEFVDTKDLGKIRPVYVLPENVKSNIYHGMVLKLFMKYGECLVESLPISILIKYGFYDIKTSLKYIHFPEDVRDLDKNVNIARERFVYEELFYLQIGLLVRKHFFGSTRGITFNVNRELLESIKDYIPFKLTNAQRRVLKDIFNDMKSENQMNRLIQGDVGSGKTIVAFISGVVAVKNGYQVAVIAPTEILSEQHYLNFKKLFGDHFLSCLLTGSLKEKEKKYLKDFIAIGNMQFIFGTHALIQEDVAFNKLGLV